MGDLLLYRIPKGQIIRSTGSFIEKNNLSEESGFVVSTFNRGKKYIFIEQVSLEDQYEEESAPFCISKDAYMSSAAEFLENLRTLKLDKAVLSRIAKVPFNINTESLFNELCKEYPNAFVYLVSSKFFGTWLGASPEVLLEIDGARGETMSLAGTMLSSDRKEWTSKEILEQDYVTRFICNELDGVGVTEIEVKEKEDIQAGPVKHIRTKLNFKLGDATPIEIINALDPTPAVSGSPRREALDLIYSTELHERSLYAGYIGVIGKKKTNIYVNLRCGKLFKDNLYLYLGGGYTADSEVEGEWIETENKAKTLLAIIDKMERHKG